MWKRVDQVKKRIKQKIEEEEKKDDSDLQTSIIALLFEQKKIVEQMRTDYETVCKGN
jgi:frataxin-like iron-binding protein CyaY